MCRNLFFLVLIRLNSVSFAFRGTLTLAAQSQSPEAPLSYLSFPISVENSFLVLYTVDQAGWNPFLLECSDAI